jgi:hypothetical protein
LLAAAPEERPSAFGRDNDVVLEVRVLEMVEGGPVTIEAVLTNKGSTTVRFNHYLNDHDVTVTAPAHWKSISQNEFYVGSTEVPIGIRPGGRRSEIVHLHRYFMGINAGKTKLAVSWSGDDAKPKAVLDIDIPPVSAERIKAIRQRLERRFDKVDKSNIDERSWVVVGADDGVMELHDIEFYFLDAPHAEFIPLSLKFLDMPGYMKARQHADYIYRSAPSTAEARQLFVDQLTRDEPPTIAPYFDKLLELGSVGFTADQIRRLERVPDLWMRAFTYIALGNRCDPEWVKRVLGDLEHSHDPPSQKVVHDLVLRLDADRWRVREDAYRELMAYGTRVRGGLRKAAKPSREVEERIEKLLKHIDKTPPDPRDVAAFEWLRRQAPQAGHTWPERCRQVLDSLSRADHSSWIAAEAQKLLAETGPGGGAPSAGLPD